MKTVLFAALLATLLAAPALADTHNIPGDNPSVTISVPDEGWKVSSIAKGIEINSEDDEVYLSVEGVPLKDIVELVSDTVTYLNRAGVEVDKSTEKETKGTINGMEMHDIGWSGKDKDGDVIIHLLIVAVSNTQAVLFTYWASPSGDKEHDAEITKLIRSVKKAG